MPAGYTIEDGLRGLSPETETVNLHIYHHFESLNSVMRMHLPSTLETAIFTSIVDETIAVQDMGHNLDMCSREEQTKMILYKVLCQEAYNANGHKIADNRDKVFNLMRLKGYSFDNDSLTTFTKNERVVLDKCNDTSIRTLERGSGYTVFNRGSTSQDIFFVFVY